MHNGLLYIFGGFNSTANIHFNDINQYNPETSTWRTISPLGLGPCARRRQICVVINNRVFISGGSSPMTCRPLLPGSLLDYDILPWHGDSQVDHDDLHILELSMKYL